MRAPRWLAGRWPWGRGRAKAAYALELDQLLAAAEVLVERIEQLIKATGRRP